MRRAQRLLVILILASLAGIDCVLAEAPQESLVRVDDGGLRIRRVIAVGDVHGDPEKFEKVLLRTRVVQKRANADSDEDSLMFFTGPVGTILPEKTVLVQMGDLVDRGHDDRRAMNMAFDLFEQQNARVDRNSSHDVVLLLGNHELMNLQKHYRYVHREDLGGFGNKLLRDTAFDKEGPYGKFIIDNFKTIHMDAGTLFVHAGITLDHAQGIESVDDFNDKVRAELRAGNFRSRLLSSYGPLWTRQVVYSAQSGNCEELDKTLNVLQVDRMVVGHTPERNGHIGEYCDGKLFTVDVGLSRWMYDGFAALEIVSVESPGLVEGNSGKHVSVWELNENGRILLWPKKAVAQEESEDLGDL